MRQSRAREVRPEDCLKRHTVQSWQEEGLCDGCGNPQFVGDSYYTRPDSDGFYCCRACAKQGGSIYPER